MYQGCSSLLEKLSMNFSEVLPSELIWEWVWLVKLIVSLDRLPVSLFGWNLNVIEG